MTRRHFALGLWAGTGRDEREGKKSARRLRSRPANKKASISLNTCRIPAFEPCTVFKGTTGLNVFGIAASGEYRAFCQGVATDSGGGYYDVP